MKSTALSSFSEGPGSRGAHFGGTCRGLQGATTRPRLIRSDASNISKGPPCTPQGCSPEKAAHRDPPKMGEGGNWQCHVCLNVNYPRRTACNRCLTERNKENTEKVAEFVRLKEGFLQMGLDQQTASAAAAAQQAARSCVSNNTSSGSLATAEKSDRLQSSSSSSGSVLALDGEGLRLLSYPLEQQPQQRSAVFDQKALKRLLHHSSPGLLRNPEQQQPQQPQQQGSCGTAKPAGISSRETSGGLLRSSSSGSNSGYSSTGCFSDEEVQASSLPGLHASLRLSSNGSAANSISTNSTEMRHIMLKAGLLVGKLLREFDDQPHHPQHAANPATAVANPAAVAKADEVLRAALGMLVGTSSAETGDHPQQQAPFFASLDSVPPPRQPQQRQHQLGFPQMLAHPDEFRNPSSFLKIYGDPLCSLSPSSVAAYVAGAGASSMSPAANKDGNWVCCSCTNVNFPRRFRCNKCNEPRGPEGDRIVAEYARAVYAHHAERLRVQQLQQQLQLLQQQDMQQLQLQMHQKQTQQQKHYHHRQRQKTAPPSFPISPAGDGGFVSSKSFGSELAAAAATAAASVASGRPLGAPEAADKSSTAAQPVTASPSAFAPTASCSLEQQQPQQKKMLQQEKRQHEEHQPAAATASPVLCSSILTVQPDEQ